jgi:hypothetical protein
MIKRRWVFEKEYSGFESVLLWNKNTQLPFRRREREIPQFSECEVFKNSLQFIRLYTVTSVTKSKLSAGPRSNRYATPLCSNGAN